VISHEKSNKNEAFTLDFNLDIDSFEDFEEFLLDLFSRKWCEDIRKKTIEKLKKPGFFVEKAKSLDFLIKDFERIELNSQESIGFFGQKLEEIFKDLEEKDGNKRKPGFFEVLKSEIAFSGLEFKALIEGLWKLRTCLRKMQAFNEKTRLLEKEFYGLLGVIIERIELISIETVFFYKKALIN